MAIISENRRAYFDYQILETLEAGIQLKGFEVKSAKAGRITIAGAFAVVRNSGFWLLNADIPPYQPKNTPADYDSRRSRKLLVKAGEIRAIAGKISASRLTLVPLKAYTKRGLVKLEIGLCRPKKKADKREILKKREHRREMERTLKA